MGLRVTVYVLADYTNSVMVYRPDGSCEWMDLFDIKPEDRDVVMEYANLIHFNSYEPVQDVNRGAVDAAAPESPSGSGWSANSSKRNNSSPLLSNPLSSNRFALLSDDDDDITLNDNDTNDVENQCATASGSRHGMLQPTGPSRTLVTNGAQSESTPKSGSKVKSKSKLSSEERKSVPEGREDDPVEGEDAATPESPSGSGWSANSSKRNNSSPLLSNPLLSNQFALLSDDDDDDITLNDNDTNDVENQCATASGSRHGLTQPTGPSRTLATIWAQSESTPKSGSKVKSKPKLSSEERKSVPEGREDDPVEGEDDAPPRLAFTSTALFKKSQTPLDAREIKTRRKLMVLGPGQRFGTLLKIQT